MSGTRACADSEWSSARLENTPMKHPDIVDGRIPARFGTVLAGDHPAVLHEQRVIHQEAP